MQLNPIHHLIVGYFQCGLVVCCCCRYCGDCYRYCDGYFLRVLRVGWRVEPAAWALEVCGCWRVLQVLRVDWVVFGYWTRRYFFCYCRFCVRLRYHRKLQLFCFWDHQMDLGNRRNHLLFLCKNNNFCVIFHFLRINV